MPPLSGTPYEKPHQTGGPEVSLTLAPTVGTLPCDVSSEWQASPRLLWVVFSGYHEHLSSPLFGAPGLHIGYQRSSEVGV